MRHSMSSLTIAVILVVVGQILALSQEEFEPTRQLCGERHNVTDEEFKLFDVNADNIDEKFKCFSHCLAEEMDYFDDTGKINAQKLQAGGHMDENELAAVETCKAEHDLEDDPCEYSFQIMKCIMKAN